MRRYVWLAASLLLVSGTVLADANTDAFSDGSSFGKGNVSQGTTNLKNPDTVTSAIPGYTDKPPQSSHYGGVTGGDGGLANDGQTAIGSNEAGQAIMSSGTTNPPPVIDRNAPFITYGKNAEGDAGTIVDGTSKQCTDTTVSKTTFENYTCDRDVAVIQTCGRTASITGHYEDDYTYQTVTIDSDSLTINSPVVTVAVPAGTLMSGSLTYEFKRNLAYSNSLWFLNITLLGSEFDMYEYSGSYTLTGGQTFSAGESLTLNLNNRKGNPGGVKDVWRIGKSNHVFHFVLTLVFREGSQKWVPEIVWSENCGFDKSTAISGAGSICTDPGGTRTEIVNGNESSIHSDCWGYSDSYLVGSDSTGTCGTLMNDKNCTRATTACTETESGVCVHQSETWQCQKTFTSGGLLCGNDYFCKTGDCNEANGAGDNGFDETVIRLAGLAAAGDDVKGDSTTVSAFSGKVMSCRKAMAGFSNCCKDSGWGQSVGLSHCNSDEKALGKAKEKKVTVYVGQKCDHKVLGVCLQKSAVYCAFGGKLARLIQEQGRRDQLGIGFGSGDSPNCSGITVPQLQSIQWDKMNFSEYEDYLRANMKVPDTGALTQQVKDRIAAQVNQLKGTTP